MCVSNRHEHQSSNLVDVINRGPFATSLGRKFLDEQRMRVNYAPMQALLDGPLYDVGANGGHTVPTALNADRMHFTKLRLDYCLVNEPLLDHCGGQRGQLTSCVVRDNKSSNLSDHFPLLINVIL